MKQQPRTLQHRKPAVSYGERFGLIIYRWRIKTRMTQGKLGEAMGVTGGTVSRIERGTQSATLDQICILSGVMGLQPEELLAWVKAVRVSE